MNGMTYLWGNISPYVLTYFHYYGDNDGTGQHDIDFSDAVYVIPLMPIVLMVMNPIGAFLLRTCANPRLMVLIGVIIMVTALYALSLTKTFNELFVIWAIKLIGAGFCYFAPLMTGWEWWEGREGIVTGVVLGAFGFSSFIFSFIASAIINPNNEQPMQLSDGNIIYSPEIATRVS